MAHGGVLIAVLAGGRGSRLGGAKPGAELAGRPLISYVLEAARATGLPVAVVAKRSTRLPELDAEVVIEPEEPRHPLTGVLAAMGALPRHDPGPAVLAVGCDTPFLTAALLAWMAGLDGAVAFAAAGRLQPLPARYPLSGIELLEESLLAERSLRDALGALQPRIVDPEELAAFGDPGRLCFNVNDASDLRLAEEWISRRRPA
ncbi:MAG: 4-diphosphocytidyl-2C-methyl-D-erythritol synthase [Solirubrobacterales bacterium]|nr:4-diphosphocytidyl-2C-methyl-D-erythritol synthase [Solirubrobacterales bacterium]